MLFEEKRKYQRRYFGNDERYLIEFKLVGKLFQKFDVALTLNISASGLLFRSTKIFSVNTDLKIRLNLPRMKKPIQITARVVRVEPTQRDGIYDIAIFYTQITDQERTLLDQFCRDKTDSSPGPNTIAEKSS